MGRITFTAYEQQTEILEDLQEEEGIDSESEAVRTCIDRADRLQQELITTEEELQQKVSNRDARIEELEQEVDRLKNEKHVLIRDRQEKQELVKYVEEEQSYRDAPIWTRAKWWVVGRDD